jgi:predicted ATPase
MITRVEVNGYRCLKSVDQRLRPYEVLVGPNASGKTSFLDVLGFLNDVLTRGVGNAVGTRGTFFDLVWRRNSNHFGISVEATIPEGVRSKEWKEIRLAIEIYLDAKTDEVAILNERVELIGADGASRPVITRLGDGVRYQDERDAQTGVVDPIEFALGPGQLGLENLPADKTRYPGALWFRHFLTRGLVRVVLDNELLKAPTPPGHGRPAEFRGAGLPRFVAQLKSTEAERYENWLQHVRTALPDIGSVNYVYRPEDGRGFLMLDYENGVSVPQWAVSDGTLRLLALTFLAYDVDTSGVYLIEEPETGLHPAAIETVVQSLKSFYDGQVLVTTHSPLVVGLTTPKELLCFSMTNEGTKIVRGDEHPYLEDWRSGLNISDLFASGVLG